MDNIDIERRNHLFCCSHYYYWSILKDFNLVRNQSSNLIDRQKKLPGRHRNYGHREVAGTANDGHRKTAPANFLLLVPKKKKSVCKDKQFS